MTPSHRIRPELEHLAVPVGDVRVYDGHPRLGDVPAAAEALRELGQYRPVIANRRTGEVLVRPELYQAAVAEGWTHIAVGWVDVDPQAAARIVVVDPRTMELGEYDPDDLRALLEAGPLTGTGWTDDDLSALANLGGPPEPDWLPPPPAVEPAPPSAAPVPAPPAAGSIREALLVFAPDDRADLTARIEQLRLRWALDSTSRVVLRALSEAAGREAS